LSVLNFSILRGGGRGEEEDVVWSCIFTLLEEGLTLSQLFDDERPTINAEDAEGSKNIISRAYGSQ